MKTNLPPTFRLLTGIAGLALTAFAAEAALAAPAKTTATQAQRAQTQKNAAVLFDLGESGENIYDAAHEENWPTALVKMTVLEKAARDLTPRWKTMGNEFRLSQSLQKLRDAVQKHQKVAAMHEANHVTLFAARLSRDTAPRVPVEITLLDVYGRALEIGALKNDRVYLARAQRDLTATWQQVRPVVVQHGGAAQARIFGALVARTAQANTPAQFARLATPILDEVDHLEAVFEK